MKIQKYFAIVMLILITIPFALSTSDITDPEFQYYSPSTMSETTTISIGASDDIDIASVEATITDGTTFENYLLTFDSEADGIETWTVELNPSIFEEGTLELSYTITDTSENTATSPSPEGIAYDTTAPTVTAVTSGNEFENTFAIQFTIEDNFPEDASISCATEVTFPDETTDAYASTIEASESVQTVTVESGETYDQVGTYTYTVSCSDIVHTTITSEESFTVVDTASPIITFTTPQEDEAFAIAVSSQTIDIDVTIDDLAVDASTAKFSIYGDDGTIVDEDVLLTDDGDGTFSKVSSAIPTTEEDNYTLIVTVEDDSGNSASESVTFYADATVPVITLTSPEDASLQSETVSVDFEVEDNYEVGTVEAQYYVSEGSAETIELTDNGDGTYSATITETSNDFTLQITATDAAGNEATSTTTFIVDSEAPTISVTSPAEGVNFDENDATATITAEISDNVELSSYTFTSTVDSVSEELTVTETSEGSNEYQATIDVSDDTQGEYTVVIEATDSVGNQASEEITFIIDTERPTTTMLNQENEESEDLIYTWTSFNEATIYFEVDDSLDTSLSCDINVIDNSDSLVPTTIETVELNLGTNSYTFDQEEWFAAGFDVSSNEGYSVTTHVSCQDDVGHSYDSFEANIYWENAGPEMTFTSPEENGAFEYDESGSQSVDLTVEITDLLGSVASATYELEYPESTGTATVTGTLSQNGDEWSDTGILTGEGTYTLTVTATDNEGEEATESITFYADATAPEIILVSPDHEGYTSAEPTFSVTVNDDISYVESVYFTDRNTGSRWIVTKDTIRQTTFEVTLTDLLSSDGDAYIDGETLSLSVWAYDAAGLQSESYPDGSRMTVTIDNTAPVIDSFSCESVTQGASAVCTCDATDATSTATTQVEADTSSTGSITAICTATDSAGNTATAETTFTVSSAPGGSSSGGGGGGSSSSSRAACNDNQDNDGDGLVDEDDPGCQNSNDDSEEDIVCRESWTCNDWSICSEDGSQTRSCFDANACSTKLARGQADVIETTTMPDELRSCTIEPTTQELQDLTEPTTTQEKPTSSGNEITGAVTGRFADTAKGLVKPAVILFSITVIVGLGVYVKRKWF